MAKPIPLLHYTVGSRERPGHAPLCMVMGPKTCVLYSPNMELLPLQILPSLSAPNSSVLKKACLCLTTGTSLELTLISAKRLKTGTAVPSLCYLEPRPRLIIGWCGRRKGKKRTIVGKGTRGKAAELCGWALRG